MQIISSLQLAALEHHEHTNRGDATCSKRHQIHVEANILVQAHLFWRYVSSEAPLARGRISSLGGLGSKVRTGRVQTALEPRVSSAL